MKTPMATDCSVNVQFSKTVKWIGLHELWKDPSLPEHTAGIAGRPVAGSHMCGYQVSRWIRGTHGCGICRETGIVSIVNTSANKGKSVSKRLRFAHLELRGNLGEMPRDLAACHKLTPILLRWLVGLTSLKEQHPAQIDTEVKHNRMKSMLQPSDDIEYIHSATLTTSGNWLPEEVSHSIRIFAICVC